MLYRLPSRMFVLRRSSKETAAPWILDRNFSFPTPAQCGAVPCVSANPIKVYTTHIRRINDATFTYRTRTDTRQPAFYSLPSTTAPEPPKSSLKLFPSQVAPERWFRSREGYLVRNRRMERERRCYVVSGKVQRAQKRPASVPASTGSASSLARSDRSERKVEQPAHLPITPWHQAATPTTNRPTDLPTYLPTKGKQSLAPSPPIPTPTPSIDRQDGRLAAALPITLPHPTSSRVPPASIHPSTHPRRIS
ncbi:hypothetical protein IWX91DRAFT_17641 [Phyllosticta citricarpa]